MTQSDRVLRALKLAGGTGITQLDFLRTPTIDGGPPITRVAARIQELRDAGHTILSDGKRGKCTVYKLRVPVVLSPPPAEAVVEELLFDPRGLSKPLGAYDDLEEAAA